MRALEFLTELRRTRGIGDITLIYDEPAPGDKPGKQYHLDQRQRERGVTVPDRESILSQIHAVRRRVLDLPRGQKFWIYDAQLDKSVGLRVVDRQNRIYAVRTVLDSRPWESDRPTFTVNAVRPVSETVSAGATSAGGIATVAQPLGTQIDRQGLGRPAKYMNGLRPPNKRKRDAGR